VQYVCWSSVPRYWRFPRSVALAQGQGLLRKELRWRKKMTPVLDDRLNVNRDAPDLSGCEWILVRFSLTELPQIWM